MIKFIADIEAFVFSCLSYNISFEKYQISDKFIFIVLQKFFIVYLLFNFNFIIFILNILSFEKIFTFVSKLNLS